MDVGWRWKAVLPSAPDLRGWLFYNAMYTEMVFGIHLFSNEYKDPQKFVNFNPIIDKIREYRKQKGNFWQNSQYLKPVDHNRQNPELPKLIDYTR